MKTYKQDGDIIVIASPSGGNAAGDFSSTPMRIRGVAVSAALVGADSPIKRNGVHTMPKATGTAWTQGQALYFDAAAEKVHHRGGRQPAIRPRGRCGAVRRHFGDVLLDACAHGERPDHHGHGVRYHRHRPRQGDLGAVASLDDAPVIGCDRAQATIGDQAGAPASGSIMLKTFKPTASGDATPIAATTFGKKVNWVAVGY
jgi:predicted RecA/RadA family phage recombinase